MRNDFYESGSQTELSFSKPFLSEHLGGPQASLKIKLYTKFQCYKLRGLGEIITKLLKTCFMGQAH